MNLGTLGEKTEPSKTAFVSLADGIHYTYADLQRISDMVAADLADEFEKGTKIALVGVNSGAYVATLLGVMKAGMVAVPVNPKLPPLRISDILADSGAQQVFADGELKASLSKTLPVNAFYTSGNRSFETVVPDDGQPALILYTSGSTGKPKGVVLSHQSHVWTALARVETLSLQDEVTLIAAPLFHMQALALAFWVLASGGTAVILPRFSTASYLDAIETYRCTFITAVPPMIEAILRDDGIHLADLSSVRLVRLGSAPVLPGLYQRIAVILPYAAILVGYGTTESGPVTFGAHPDGVPLPSLSYGYPHPEIDVRLNDDSVLEIRSPALMNGYHKRPELSPFTEDGYYVTGDVFRRDDKGFYAFVGRADDMFVSGGENIYPGEVETLLATHPDVVNSCVVPVDDEIKGTKPVAFVIRHGSVTEEKLRQHVLDRAAPHIHPRRVWFLDSFPVTDTNKIDRKKLMAEAEKRVREKEHA